VRANLIKLVTHWNGVKKKLLPTDSAWMGKVLKVHILFALKLKDKFLIFPVG
jgi:hypothetical protein